MPPRAIMVVSHLAPPSTMSAARRVAGLTRHLAARGHRVTVVTSTVAGTGPVEGAVRTVRTRDLMASRLNWRAGSFEALAGTAPGDYDPRPSALAAVVVPDVLLVGWVPFALPRALGAAGGVDAVITSSPPASTHLIGLALRRRGVPWIADFRDGWTFERGGPDFPVALQRRLDRALERAVATRADRLAAVTPPIADDLARRFGRPVATITNGFDPDEPVAEVPAPARPRADRHTLVYTGSFAYGGRPLESLLAALRRVSRAADRLELVVAGPTSPAERAALDDDGLAGIVRTVGSLPHDQALGLQRAADSLLVVAGERQRSVATGKLYEYLAAGRPILVLGAHSAAARIVASAGAGIAVRADDPNAIAGGLTRLVAGERFPAAGARALRRYSYPEIAAEMEAEVERAIAAD